ncbi:MAG: hypothetical protein RR403_07170, partial [Pseudoflavonifractor sp.]
RNLMVFATLLALVLGMSACGEQGPVAPTTTPTPPITVRPVETAPDGTVGNAARPHASPSDSDTVRRHAGEGGRAAEGEYQSR